MSDKGDCMTSLATPGLLKITHNWHMFLEIQEVRVLYKHEKLDQTDCWNVISDCWKKLLYLASDY